MSQRNMTLADQRFCGKVGREPLASGRPRIAARKQGFDPHHLWRSVAVASYRRMQRADRPDTKSRTNAQALNPTATLHRSKKSPPGTGRNYAAVAKNSAHRT
ncbi:hypothetical protein, partial [Azospirillum sp. B506]|uniref:hypothetical protein n=1 Tax=Azospirillum sp. B506 TaxID=137721 RepID=UPI001B3BF058